MALPVNDTDEPIRYRTDAEREDSSPMDDDSVCLVSGCWTSEYGHKRTLGAPA